MARVLILYDSKTGNTAQPARLVSEGASSVPDTEVRVRTIDEAVAEDIFRCDGLAMGSPTDMGLLSWKMKKFWDETMCEHWMKVDGKVGCVFTSAGGWGGGMEIACRSLLTLLMNFGFPVFGVTDYATQLSTCHYGAVTAREPRGEDARATCRLLGKRLAEWTAVLFDGRKDLHPCKRMSERLKPS